MTASVAQVLTSLADQWRADRQANPRSHARDAAKRLGVSEAELIATECGTTATRLAPRWIDLVTAFATLGVVKTMTRNDHAVIEKDGVFENIQLAPAHGTVLGEIDLRLFFRPWSVAFAMAERSADGSVRRSVQVYDRFGESVHKLFVQTAEAVPAFDTLVERFRDPDQGTHFRAGSHAVATGPNPDHDIDVAALGADWDALTDTHDFLKMLSRHRVARTQALRLAGTARARRVPVATVERLLIDCAADGEKLMVFVGNRGMLQVVSGPIHRVVRSHGWLNILDPGFNLHLRDEALTDVYVVHKPTAEGVATSLEGYDAAGETVVLFHGYRKDGAAGCAGWEARLRDLGATS